MLSRSDEDINADGPSQGGAVMYSRTLQPQPKSHRVKVGAVAYNLATGCEAVFKGAAESESSKEWFSAGFRSSFPRQRAGSRSSMGHAVRVHTVRAAVNPLP